MIYTVGEWLWDNGHHKVWWIWFELVAIYLFMRRPFLWAHRYFVPPPPAVVVERTVPYNELPEEIKQRMRELS